MLNILSTTEKKKILVEYRFRLAVISIFAVGALVLSSLILLVPSYLLAISKQNNAKTELAFLESKQGDGQREKDMNAQIRNINNKISSFLGGNTSTRLVPSQILSSLLKMKGGAIKIYGFTYDAVGYQEKIVIVGKAPDRESLAAFIETLKKDQTYTNVTLPISSYVKSTNIDFSIVLERTIKPSASAKK